MPINLNKGAITGRTTKLYYNDPDAGTPGTFETPVWAEIKRARNIQKNDGRATGEVDFHGNGTTSGISGYKKFSGSFEYVKKRGTDAIFDFLLAASLNGDIVDLAHLNGDIDTDDIKGWRCPVLLGEFSDTANGGDAVVVTIPFVKADAYDDSDVAIDKTRALTASGAITDPDASP